ncbi:hypothetical protein G6539_21730 [Streptomyces albidoflavus]|nr:hypothetical protein [Streptomyces albidoflavus]
MPSSARRPVAAAITANCGAASHRRSVMSPEETSAVIVLVTAGRPRAARTPVAVWRTSSPDGRGAVHAPGQTERAQDEGRQTPRRRPGGQQRTGLELAWSRDSSR